jgi:hypothetical protein
LQALRMSGELQTLREGIADSYDVQSLAALRHSNSLELTKARMLACWRGAIREERNIFDANQLHLWARVEACGEILYLGLVFVAASHWLPFLL